MKPAISPLQVDMQDPVNQMAFLRGLFLSSYAQVEFAVTELLLRALQKTEYRRFGAVPKSWAQRLVRLRQVLSSSGPLERHAADIRSHLVPLTAFEPYRHSLAHGRMFLCAEPEPPKYIFASHAHRSKDAVTQQVYEIGVGELAAMTVEFGRAAQRLVSEFDRIMSETKLGPVPLAGMEEHVPSPRDI